ncbi:16623_t:CDS:1, partial [Acaulospora colombiana]
MTDASNWAAKAWSEESQQVKSEFREYAQHLKLFYKQREAELETENIHSIPFQSTPSTFQDNNIIIPDCEHNSNPSNSSLFYNDPQYSFEND